MPVRIFTIPFDEETQTFHDDLVTQFCVNKRVHKIETMFFTRNHQPFWTVAIQYGQILSDEKNIRVNGTPAPEQLLDEQQKALLLRMKEWRKGMADTAGLPVYMIATNAQFVSIIQQKCATLESLKLVKGFGKTKMEKYGQALTDMVRQFYHGDPAPA
ncbi:MAG: HRDC domain-containing protein [Saprospiraceae bacterium]|nr:HRDC domain-containing protein [Saprospiraceae bacterium]